MIIYKVTFPNGKAYIGLTKNALNLRRNNHYFLAKRGSKSAFHLALSKYSGQETWEIIDSALDYEELKFKEIIHISNYQTLAPNGYNLTVGGDGTIGHIMTPEQRSNISKCQIGRPSKKKGRKFKPFTEAHKLKNSLIMQSIWTEKLTKEFIVYKNEELIGIFKNQNECARNLNIKVANLNKCLTGIRKTTGGFSFKWKD